jgi:hypothetical protein
MKKKFYAQVEMKITRQVEFECDENLPNKVIEEMAIKLAQKEFGECEEADVVEMDYA